MKKASAASIILFVVCLSFCFGTQVNYTDSTSFKIDIVIRYECTVQLGIAEYDDASTTISSSDISPADAQTSYPVCRILYDSNIIGQNSLSVTATPFYPIDDNEVVDQTQPSAYSLDFSVLGTYSGEEHLDVLDSQSSSTVSIPVYVPTSFSSGNGLYSTAILVNAVFTAFDSMAAGRHVSNVIIGVEMP